MGHQPGNPEQGSDRYRPPFRGRQTAERSRRRGQSDHPDVLLVKVEELPGEIGQEKPCEVAHRYGGCKRRGQDDQDRRTPDITKAMFCNMGSNVHLGEQISGRCHMNG